MRHEDGHQEAVTGDRAGCPDGWAVGPAAGGQVPPSVPPGAGGGERSGRGGLWLLLAPLACCGGPLLIAGLAAGGALAWGGLGLGAAALLAVIAALAVRRRRRSRACRDPGAAGWAGQAGTADRRPAAR